MHKSVILLLATAVGAASFAESPANDAHYDIKAKLDLRTGAVVADVVITLPPSALGAKTSFVLGDWLTLRHVYAAGASTHVEPTDKPSTAMSEIIFDFKQPPTRPVALHFSYGGLLQAAGQKPVIDAAEGVELGFEDGWIPVKASFNLLFTVDANIQGIPAADVVVAQGRVLHHGNRLLIHRDFEDIDMPFAALRGLRRSVDPDVEVYARHPDGVLEMAYRTQTAPILAYYRSLFGPLPPSALPERLVVLPRRGAAYERRAYISIPDGTEELHAFTGHVEDWMLVGTLSHEISHGWWWHADPLTEDHWLNESMAEYSSLRFVEAMFGTAPLKQRLDHKREQAATAGPIIGHGRPNKVELYSKGPVLLFELDTLIGRTTMDAFLGIIGQHPPRTTAQFLQRLSEVAGTDAAREFEARLRS